MQTIKEKVDTSKALDASSVDTKSSRTESVEQDTSSRLGNDAHTDDADIKPIYDEEPMAEVQLISDHNVFATRQQYTEQPEFNNEGEVDQNAEQCHDTCPFPAKLTDNQTTELSNQSLEFAIISQLQEKGFAIAELENELRKLRGNNMNTKFARTSILGKPVLQPHRNQSVVRQLTGFKSERPRISKPRFASQVDVNNNLPKPVTTHYLPKGKESACAKPHHMIAPGSSRYSSNDTVHNHYLEEAKKQTQEIGTSINVQEEQNLDLSVGLGSTSGIRACALRNFDLEVMELENTQNNALAKLPMLKLGEYEMWEIRIKQYFQIQDYALWEVIENGNSWVPIPVTTPSETGTSTATKMTMPSTTEEKTCKKNDVKARSLLLMALPNEHQLTFDQYVDAQSMFAAIKARFGGNEATKKTQKALLKQQYENFSASSSESLDSIFNRLQRLVSRLAILGVVTPPEDLNVKFF
ncbi:hypothetical protein Tco_0868743 [Tanacetum coccineum]